MYLAVRQQRARDWATNLEISPKHDGKADVIEYHHIFPKAFMKRNRPDLIPRDVDDMANLAFISSATNKKISDRAPAEYRHDFTSTLFAAQFIDFENGLDAADSFEEFMSARREAVVHHLNKFLDIEHSTQADES